MSISRVQPASDKGRSRAFNARHSGGSRRLSKPLDFRSKIAVANILNSETRARFLAGHMPYRIFRVVCEPAYTLETTTRSNLRAVNRKFRSGQCLACTFQRFIQPLGGWHG